MIARGASLQARIRPYMPLLKVHAGIGGSVAIESILLKVMVDEFAQDELHQDYLYYAGYAGLDTSILDKQIFNDFLLDVVPEMFPGFIANGMKNYSIVDFDDLAGLLGEYVEFHKFTPNSRLLAHVQEMAAGPMRDEMDEVDNQEGILENDLDPMRDVMLNQRARQQWVLQNFRPEQMDFDESDD